MKQTEALAAVIFLYFLFVFFLKEESEALLNT